MFINIRSSFMIIETIYSLSFFKRFKFVSLYPMEKDQFPIHKELFIQSKKDNILNHYQFNPKELGKGAYGVVYKAREKGSKGEWRAVKKIAKKNIKNPDLFLNQIQVLKGVDHPSCIKLYQTFQDDRNVFLVTDLCEGGQLFDRLETDGNFSEDDARKIFIQIIEAVNYCHSHKIAHRDLKPQNFLFLNKKGLELKLIDFGLAYPWKEDMRKQLAQKGEKKLVGTSYYIAPEIINGSYDQRCDIWSAGVILYILLSAVPPFDGDNDKQIIEEVRKLKYDINIPQLKHVSNDAKTLISRILLPEGKRIGCPQIFKDSWVLRQAPKNPLKLNFTRMQSFSKFSKIKKLAATFIATQLSQKEVQNLGNLFKQIDLNHDGQLSIQQLKAALKDEKNQPSLKELSAVMDSIDTDNNGKINYTQFLASCMDQSKLFTEDHIKSVFKMIDKDGNGFVERGELLAILESHGTPMLNGKNVDEIISTCDKDGNGLIDYNEFKASILS